MAITLAPRFRDLTFMAPLSDERAARLVEFISRDQRGRVVDIGCGWAELLLRILEAAPHAQGVGIDQDVAALGHGRALATTRDVADRVTLVEADVAGYRFGEVAAAVCVGASHAWPRPARADARMNYGGALRGLRGIVARGGRVVFGEGIWTTPPTPAATAALGGRDDEMVGLPELLDLAVDAGFAVQAFHESTLDEWDAFESGYSACYASWLAEHAVDDPDGEQVRDRARQQRDGYLRGYRGVLGMAYLHLIAV